MKTQDATYRRLQLPHLPMKDMDGAMLAIAIIQETPELSSEDHHQLREAMALAAYLHRTDSRQNPTISSSGRNNQPTSPYIEHPLRNTLRLIRWGVRDKNILIASLLHDVVEDHAADIVNDLTSFVASDNEHRNRLLALNYLAQAFGDQLAYVVEGVSNPILPESTPREEKMRRYAEHVELEVNRDPSVFLVKFSDFTDNALGLHHQPLNSGTRYRARKYLPLAPVFVSAWGNNQAYRLLSDKGIELITARLAGAETYLTDILNRAEKQRHRA